MKKTVHLFFGERFVFFGETEVLVFHGAKELMLLNTHVLPIYLRSFFDFQWSCVKTLGF